MFFSRGALACGLLILGMLSPVEAQTGAITGPSSLPPTANPVGIANPASGSNPGTPTTGSSPAGGVVATPPVVAPIKTFMVPAPPFPAHDPLSDPLYQQVTTAIQVTSQRYLTANVHTPWQIFHGILALHESFQLKLGNEKVSAISWIASSNPQFDGKPWILITPNGGKFHPFTRPYAFEGHPSQFLALLSESNLPPTFAFKTPTRDVTITEMLQTSMRDVNDREEITWVLWALVHYYPTTTQWANARNEPWSIERLVQIQNAAAVEKGACGGNHGLFALARARDKHVQEGLPLNGVWFEADYKIKRYTETARSMQNPDGTFSSKFYQGPGYTTDLNSRLNTTGHTLEFLSAALPAARLNEPWVRNAVTVLSKDMIDNRKAPSDCGPLYHSLNALRIYHSRAWPQPAAEPKSLNEPKPLAELPGVTANPVTPPAADPAPASASSPVIPGAAPVQSPPIVTPAPAPVTPVTPTPEPLKPASSPSPGNPTGNETSTASVTDNQGPRGLSSEEMDRSGEVDRFREQEARLRSLNVSGTGVKLSKPTDHSELNPNEPNPREPERFQVAPFAISILAPASALRPENAPELSSAIRDDEKTKTASVPATKELETKELPDGQVNQSLSTDENRNGWTIRSVPYDLGTLKPVSNQVTETSKSTVNSPAPSSASDRRDAVPDSSLAPPPSRPLLKSGE